MLVFGLAKTFFQAVSGRVISGLLSGNLGVLKSFLTEITDESNRGTGFSIMSVAWTIGTIIAPLAGGLLCKPAEKFPAYFAENGLFGVYPYLLPCSLCVFFNVFSALFCLLFMAETRKPNNRMKESLRNLDIAASKKCETVNTDEDTVLDITCHDGDTPLLKRAANTSSDPMQPSLHSSPVTVNGDEENMEVRQTTPRSGMLTRIIDKVRSQNAMKMTIRLANQNWKNVY